MRKPTRIMLALLMALVSLSVPATTITKSFNDYTMTYETLTETTCKLINCEINWSASSDMTIVIPDNVQDDNGNEYAVVKMAADVFPSWKYGDYTLSLGENLVSKSDPWGLNGTGDYESIFPDGTRYFKKLIFRDGVKKIPVLLCSWNGSSVEEVELGKDVKTIEMFAFNGFSNLRSINTENVDSIGSSAFASCSSLETLDLRRLKYVDYMGWGLNLENIYFGQDVEYIADGWLNYSPWYKNLTNTTYIGKVLLRVLGADLKATDFVVKKGTKQISSDAFYGCQNLTTLTLPASLPNLGDTFSWCIKLNSFNIASDNPWMKSMDGVAYSKDGKTLLRLPLARTEYNAPAEIDSVAPNAYAGGAIEKIVLPQVKYLSSGCVQGCWAMKELVFPQTLEWIDNGYGGINNPFSGCSSLKEINLPAKAKYLNGDRAVLFNPGMYYELPSLESFNVEEGHPQFKSIDGVAYSKEGNILYYMPDASSITDFVVPESVDSIADWSLAFSKNLRKVEMRNNNLTLGYGLFNKSENLEEVTFPSEVKDMSFGPLFAFCKKIKSIILPEVTSPYMANRGSLSGTFLNCKSLESVVLPQNTPQLSADAFTGCEALKSLTIKSETPPFVYGACYEYDENDGWVYDENGSPITRYPLFYDVNVATCQLYVPEQSLDSYNNADGWKEFYYINAITTSIKDIPFNSVKNNIYYNLKGQKVGNPRNGIYIKNGKKIIVK